MKSSGRMERCGYTGSLTWARRAKSALTDPGCGVDRKTQDSVTGNDCKFADYPTATLKRRSLARARALPAAVLVDASLAKTYRTRQMMADLLCSCSWPPLASPRRWSSLRPGWLTSRLARLWASRCLCGRWPDSLNRRRPHRAVGCGCVHPCRTWATRHFCPA